MKPIEILILGCFREINSKQIIGCFQFSNSYTKLIQNLDECIKETNPIKNKHELCVILTNSMDDISLKNVKNVNNNLIATLWSENTEQIYKKYCLATWQ